MELHDEIQKLHVLSTFPEYYEIFVKFNSVSSLLGLLSHENSGAYIFFICTFLFRFCLAASVLFERSNASNYS